MSGQTTTTFTVSNTNNNGTGSLREAIASASAGNTILFDSSLSNTTISPDSQLEIDKNLTINGENAPGLTLDGQGKYPPVPPAKQQPPHLQKPQSQQRIYRGKGRCHSHRTTKHPHRRKQRIPKPHRW